MYLLSEIEGKMCSDSAGAALSGKVSTKDPTDPPSQPITPVRSFIQEQSFSLNNNVFLFVFFNEILWHLCLFRMMTLQQQSSL